MMSRLALLCLAAAGCVSHLPPPGTPLADKMIEEIERDAALQLPAVTPRRFLFVGGFLNEAIPGYFADASGVARDELGGEPTVLFPSSLSGLTEDADLIMHSVLGGDERPVVLVGHSKGGAAVLLAVIRHPELILSGRVESVIVIQGAIGGSPLADSIGGTGRVHLPVAFQGLSSLKTLQMRALFEAGRRTLALEQAERISERVFYVRSCERASEVGPHLAPSHRYLNGFGSRCNDGMLLKEDMLLEGLGVDLGVLKGDHASLTVSSFLSNSSPKERRAFARAVFREVLAR